MEKTMEKQRNYSLDAPDKLIDNVCEETLNICSMDDQSPIDAEDIFRTKNFDEKMKNEDDFFCFTSSIVSNKRFP